MYHLKNSMSKRNIRKIAKNIIPTGLMKNDTSPRAGAGQRRVEQNIIDMQNLRMSKNDGK